MEDTLVTYIGKLKRFVFLNWNRTLGMMCELAIRNVIVESAGG